MADAGRSPRATRSAGPAAAGTQLRQRKGGAATAKTGGAARATGGGNGSLWRLYTEDSTGLKIGPVPVLVMSLVFIACVFVLHIWGKYTRSRA